MSELLAQMSRRPTAAFAERCRALGLPVWSVDARGAISSRPDGWGHAGRWLAAPALERWIARAASTDAPTGAVIDLFPGCWLAVIGLSGEAGGERALALALGPDVPGGEEFLAICGSANLDGRLCQTWLAPLARHDRASIERLARMLAWMAADLDERAQHAHTIGVFTRELSATYEQLSAVFRLSSSFSSLDRPSEFVALACALLQRTLDFDWVALALDPGRSTALAGLDAFVIAGTPPVPVESLAAATLRQMRELDLGTSEPHLLPGAHAGVEHPGHRLLAPVRSRDEIIGALVTGQKRGHDPEVTSVDSQLVCAFGEGMGAFMQNVAMFQEQKALVWGTLQALTAAIDAKDEYTHGHSERVALLATMLARAAEFPEEQMERVHLAGLVHDIGKIGVPDRVLRKRGRLTAEEYEELKRHPTVGCAILKDLGPMADLMPGVRHHHERWDGRGYPDGLRGEAIPILGRLLAVADAFDAMSSDRSYRQALDRQRVMQEIETCSGTQFDPDLARLALNLDLSSYDRMLEEHRRRDAESSPFELPDDE